MPFLLTASLLFSLVAVIGTALVGHRRAPGGDQVCAIGLAVLLVLPLLVLLPGWSISAAPGLPGPERLPDVLPWILPLGTAAALLRLLVSSVQLRNWIRSSTFLEHCPTAGGRAIEIRVLPELRSPCAAGIRRPVILVPSDWSTTSRLHRDMVLAHEIAHHRRRDPLWRLLASITCALHWFNPLVWWLARRQAFHAELACDAAVIANGAPVDRYAHLLCDLAMPEAPPLATAMGGSALGKRVVHLTRPSGRLPRWSVGLIGVFLVISGLACGLTRPQAPVPLPEIQLRLSADPFPGDR